MIEAAASTVVSALASKLLGGSGGTSQEQKQVDLAHPSVNQTLLRSDPLYAYAVLMARNGHKATTGYYWSTNSDAAGITAAISGHYASLRAKYPNGAPAGILEAITEIGWAAPATAAALTQGTQNMDLTSLLQVAVNSASTALANRISGAVIPDSGPIMQSTIPMQTVGLPALPSFGALLGGAGRVVGAAIGAVRSVSGRVVGFILANGRRVSVKDAAALAAQVGITAAAATLGASEQEVAEAVLAAMKRRGRGRGITAAQLRTTRRTIGKLERAHKQIAKAARQHVR